MPDIHQTILVDKSKALDILNKKLLVEEEFLIVSGLLNEKVNYEYNQFLKSATNFTNMFTVDFNAKSHVATFHMLTNDANSRRVILRFLGANQIANVQVADRAYDLGAFFENFLQ